MLLKDVTSRGDQLGEGSGLIWVDGKEVFGSDNAGTAAAENDDTDE